MMSWRRGRSTWRVSNTDEWILEEVKLNIEPKTKDILSKWVKIIGTSGKITRGKSECAKNWPFSMKLLITVFRQLVIKFVTEVISWPVHLQHHTPLSSAICMLESLPSFLTWPFGIFWLWWRWVPRFQIESVKMKKTETPFLGYFSCE